MRTTTYNHKYFKSLIKNNSICIDMTTGNGNDTEFLASKALKVYAFDIQEEAINKTKKRLQKYTNIKYINDNYKNVLEHIKEEIDFVFFNLGYLPNSESNLVSDYHDTIKAIEDVYKIMKHGAYMSIIIYRGHSGGLYEYHNLLSLFNKNKYHIIDTYLSYTYITEPILFIIKKD